MIWKAAGVDGWFYDLRIVNTTRGATPGHGGALGPALQQNGRRSGELAHEAWVRAEAAT